MFSFFVKRTQSRLRWQGIPHDFCSPSSPRISIRSRDGESQDCEIQQPWWTLAVMLGQHLRLSIKGIAMRGKKAYEFARRSTRKSYDALSVIRTITTTANRICHATEKTYTATFSLCLYFASYHDRWRAVIDKFVLYIVELSSNLAKRRRWRRWRRSAVLRKRFVLFRFSLPEPSALLNGSLVLATLGICRANKENTAGPKRTSWA